MAAKHSVLLLLDEINRLNDNAFALSDLDFGEPSVVMQHDRNSMVVVTATQASKYTGTQNVFYDRLDLTRVFSTAGIEQVELKGFDVRTTLDLLKELNHAYDLALDDRDIIDEPLDFTHFPQKVVLKVKPGSLAFHGELIVTVVDGILDLDEVITVQVLSGLYYINDLSSVIVNDGMNGFTPAGQ